MTNRQYWHWRASHKIGIIKQIIYETVGWMFMSYSIDFRKAFDLVDHGILLRKLAELNVPKCFWLWTRSFLEGRSQQVNLVGALSSTMPCPLGVPQGSVLSPTLFNVHVIDFEDSIPDHLNINTYKYPLVPLVTCKRYLTQ